MFEQLEAQMQATVFKHASNCTVVSGSDEFRAIFNNPDTSFDPSVTVSTPELRYPSAFELVVGDAITIDGAAYLITGVPRRIGSGGESVVPVEPA